MATSHIRSCRIIQEASFGSLDTETGLPDRTIFDGVDDLAFDVDRASVSVFGEHPQNERDDIRSGFHGIPADPETIVDANGDPVQRRTGQITLEVTIRSIGTEDPDDVPLLWAIGSGMTPLGYPTNAEVTVETGGTAGSFVVADAVAAADLPTGGMIAYVPATVGNAAFAQIVEKASDSTDTTVEYSPLLPATLATSDVIRTVATFGSLPGRALDSSVAMRFDGHGWRAYAWGCRMVSLALAGDNRRLRGTIVLEAAIIQTAHDEVSGTTNMSARPWRPAGGQVLHTLGSEVTLSDVIEGAANAPRVGGRNVLCVDDWSVTITNTLSPITCWGGILGMTDRDVTDRMCEVSLTLSTPAPAVSDAYLNQSHRTLALSWGPAPGMGLILPAAYLTADPQSRDLGGDLVRQVLNYREGLPLTVTPLGGEGSDHLANSPILLGFGLTPAA